MARKCRHCQRKDACRPKRLCWTCYYTPGVNGKPWTKRELAIVRRNYHRVPARDLSARLNRSITSIRQAAFKVGRTRRKVSTKGLDDFVRTKHAAGWCDPHIASAWTKRFSRDRLPLDRHTVAKARSRFGLGAQHHSCPLCLERTRQTTKRQCREAGVKNMAEIRALAFRHYARRYGWPEDLRPRAVQILNALARKGPMTKNELAAAIGARWQNVPSRKVLVSNDPEGSYLAHLIRRGLVVTLGRRYSRGYQWQMVYSLALGAQRRLG